MEDPFEVVYEAEPGEEIPIGEVADIDNIQDRHADWFKQNDLYKRHMCLSYLPNDVSMADLRALVHAEGVEEFSASISNYPNDGDIEQPTLLAAQKSIQKHMLEESKVSKKERSDIVSDLADETTQKVEDITVRASIIFQIEAESKEQLEDNTKNVKQKAEKIGAEVAALEESPEEKIIAMNPKLPINKKIIEEYCITVDAATAAMIQMFQIPQELLDDLYKETKDPIYIL